MQITNTTIIEKPEDGYKIILTQGPGSIDFISFRLEDNGHNVEMTLDNEAWKAAIDGVTDMLQRAR